MLSRICSVEGCGLKHYGQGFCVRHLYRYKRYGDPLHLEKVPPGDPLCFIQDVALKYAGDTCLLWPFARVEDGYGRVGRKRAHRVICELVYGPAPKGKTDAAHSCGNPSCVNPAHIRWASRAENCADRKRHGTDPIGDRNPNTLLTVAQVRAIRASRKPHHELAREFGVKRRTIRTIIYRENWKWVD